MARKPAGGWLVLPAGPGPSGTVSLCGLARPGRGGGAWPARRDLLSEHPVPAALVVDVPVGLRRAWRARQQTFEFAADCGTDCAGIGELTSRSGRMWSSSVPRRKLMATRQPEG